jgi:hypothetical protein
MPVLLYIFQPLLLRTCLKHIPLEIFWSLDPSYCNPAHGIPECSFLNQILFLAFVLISLILLNLKKTSIEGGEVRSLDSRFVLLNNVDLELPAIYNSAVKFAASPHYSLLTVELDFEHPITQIKLKNN